MFYSADRDSRQGEDTDDINLEVMMKTQAQLNAQHKISSIVQNAAADALATAAIRSSAAAASAGLGQQHIQSGHQAIKEQMARAAAAQAQVNAAAGSSGGVELPPRTQADILKENLSNIKDEINDSDCELVETDPELVSTNSIQVSN